METSGNARNAYLDEVVAKQQQLEVDLKRKQALAPSAAPAGQRVRRAETGEMRAARVEGALAGQPSPAAVSNAVDVRITGWGWWQNVIVPPNAYVVHTRRGHSEPLHIGLGVSFRFNPSTDSFLAVPGAMQTIVINAHCICKELQGLLVQGYVQWIVADFATAFKKLDFSDLQDPMRVVNLQLREQAEAAIKDKVATMSIDSVLSDKQPIIEELTARLRHVAEGEGGSDKGLGLRIVTVQIKEAVVSSSRLWESLQKPFRAERARIARLAELEAEESIQNRAAQTEKAREASRMSTQSELAVLRSKNEAESFDRERAEQLRRSQLETSSMLELAALEKRKLTSSFELASLRSQNAQTERKLETEGQLAVEEMTAEARHRRAMAGLDAFERRQRVTNALTPSSLQAKLIDVLPELLEKMPKPDELRSINIGGGGELQSIAGLVAQLMSVVDAVGGARRQPTAEKE